MLTKQDRYMMENKNYTARARAAQGVAEGNAKRLREKIADRKSHDVGTEQLHARTWLIVAEQ